MTKEELSQLKLLNSEIEELKRRREKFYELCTCPTPAISDLPHAQGVNDKVGKYVAMLSDLDSEIDKKINCLWAKYKKMDEYISSIGDSYLRQIFSYRYINGLDWAQVAAHIGGGNADSVRMAHNRFLKKTKSKSKSKEKRSRN